MIEGEIYQLTKNGDANITEDEHFDIVRRKTAYLFAGCARIGGMLGPTTREQQEALWDYGLNIGMAFQLVDDALDYSGDISETGKNLGDDLNEGKPTMPLLRVMQSGSAQQSALVRNAIEQGGREDFALVMQAINATDALQYTRDRAKESSDRAIRAIEKLKATPYRESLLELARFAVDRSH